jgi:rhamnogalacturonyl hydrolase YesR
MMKKNILFLTFINACLLLISSCRQNANPSVFDPDVIKATMNRAAEWQIKHPRHAPNDWTNGAFYAGLFAAWETTRSQTIYDAMMAMGRDSTQWRPYYRWYHADDIAICQTYIDLYRIEKKQEMIQPTIDTLAVLMANPYPVKGIEVIKWWWCDALFMAPPVLVKMGITTGNSEYLRYNDQCFKECYDLLYNREEHLFARDLGYVIKQDSADRWEANGQRIFWSRGNGWVMGGLVRILKELPANYPERPFYEQLYREMAARILSLQQQDGLWRASLLDPDSYPGGEVSGSGFFCYALAWGINNGLLDGQTYLSAVEKAWTALNLCVNEEGRVGWVQPIGADPRKNFSADSWEVYGTGAFLLAGSEIIKLNR